MELTPIPRGTVIADVLNISTANPCNIPGEGGNQNILGGGGSLENRCCVREKIFKNSGRGGLRNILGAESIR
jgi:hypothetical protein